MKLPFNVRVPVLSVIALICGIALGYLIIRYNLNPIIIAAIVPATAAIFIFTAIFAQGRKIPIIIIACGLILLCGTLGSFLRLKKFSDSLITEGAVYSITGEVTEKGSTQYGEYIILGNVKIGDCKLNGKLIAYLGPIYGQYCEEGYKVSFISTLSKSDLIAYGKLSYPAINNLTYSCSVYGGLTSKYKFSLFGAIRSSIRKTLYNNLDSETAATAFAMLTGNTQNMENAVLTNFRYGGIAHIFAVSGLHIGIIYGVVYFILRALKLNKYAVAAVCVFTLFFYAGICGFTLSSVRAAIMCTVAALSKLIYKKYDTLNSLATAVFIILIIAPLSLFSAGFLLSVCAVTGIALLTRKFVATFNKLPKKITEPVGVTLSAQAGTLPVMLANFGYISGAGLILNIIIIPVLSALFVLLFGATFISVIIPFIAGYVLPVAAFPLAFIISFFVDAGFEKALISGLGGGIVIALYYLFILIVSDKLNITRLKRLIAVLCSVTVLCGYILGQKFIPVSGCKFSVSAYGGGQVLIKSGTQSVLVISGRTDIAHTLVLLNENYVTELDCVVILGGEESILGYDTEIPCKNIYAGYSLMNTQPFKGITINYVTSFTAGNADFSFGDESSILIDSGQTKTAICTGGTFPFENCDILISDCAIYGDCQMWISFNRSGTQNCAYDKGTVNFKSE